MGLAMFMGFTENLKVREVRRVLTQSIITAFLIGIVFLFLGRWIFKILGVLVADFKIAGGLVLLAISLRDILTYEKGHKLSPETMGAVPIGTPLITGPAVLTTTLMMVDSHGIVLTFVSLVANRLIVWFTLVQADGIIRVMGTGGARALSKITYIVLAAIGVMMVRHGLEAFLR